MAPSSSIWENRTIDLSPPVCSVSRRGISFILSGKTHLQPLSLNMFSSMSPLVKPLLLFPLYVDSQVRAVHGFDGFGNIWWRKRCPIDSFSLFVEDRKNMVLCKIFVMWPSQSSLVSLIKFFFSRFFSWEKWHQIGLAQKIDGSTSAAYPVTQLSTRYNS